MSDDSNIAVEREKTKRLMITVGAGAVLGVLAMILFFNTVGNRKGDLDIDITSGKFKVSLDKPIGEQVQQSTSSLSTKDGPLQFNTGTISDSVIKNVEAQGQKIDPTKFTGKNLISSEAGFVLSANEPSKWTVTYDPSGLHNSDIPVTTITGDGFGNVKVVRRANTGHVNIRTFIGEAVATLRSSGVINSDPEIQFDDQRKTAFLTVTNIETGGQSYVKVVIYNNTVFVASADYNALLTDESTKNDLIGMVASFSPIAK